MPEHVAVPTIVVKPMDAGTCARTEMPAKSPSPVMAPPRIIKHAWKMLLLLMDGSNVEEEAMTNKTTNENSARKDHTTKGCPAVLVFDRMRG